MQCLDCLGGLRPNLVFNRERADHGAVSKDIENCLSFGRPHTYRFTELGWNRGFCLLKQSWATDSYAVPVHTCPRPQSRQCLKVLRWLKFNAPTTGAAHNGFPNRVFGVFFHGSSKA